MPAKKICFELFPQDIRRQVLDSARDGVGPIVVKGIKPTAGYPVDAKRFRAEIEQHATKLGLQQTDWWRVK